MPEESPSHRVAARLHDEDIRAPHVFQDLKINLAVAEAMQGRLPGAHAQKPADVLRQRQVRPRWMAFNDVVPINQHRVA